MAAPSFRSLRALLLAAAALGASLALAASARAEPRKGVAPPEVLTLEEAAELLRVAPDDVRDLAERHGIPGRRIGVEWRFSRQALLAWLASSEPPAAALAEEELASIAARGPEGGAGEEPVIGEQPEVETAEEVFLRDQEVLLGRGDLIVETRIFYSSSDEPGIVLREFDLGGTPILFLPEQTTIQQDTITSSLSLRYGLLEETEILAGSRFQHQTFDPGPAFSVSRTNLWSLFAGARRTILQERRRVPDVVLSVLGDFPLDHESSFAVAGGLSLVKSFDPIVLFGSVEYRHAFSPDLDDLHLLEPEDAIGATLGYAFAVNDELTLSTAVSGLFSWETEFSNHLVLESDQEFSMRLGLTRATGWGPYFEPSVTWGLNDAGNFVILGLSMPWWVNR